MKGGSISGNSMGCYGSQGLTAVRLQVKKFRRVYLNPEEPTFLKDLYREITIRNPKKVGSSWLR